MKKYILMSVFLTLCFSTIIFGQAKDGADDQKYKLLATTRTKTMQKELNQVSAQGYRILVGSPTSGSEMAVFLTRDATIEEPYQYKLLATTRTGTMQKELNQTADAGFRLLPRTMIAKSQLFGGVEIVMIMEKPPKVTQMYEYKLLATNRTSTLQKEVNEAQAAGFTIVGMVSRGEHMIVMERESALKP